MQQLGELQKSADALGQQADVYVINRDSPEDSRQLKQISGISLPVLLDPQLTVARQYDMLPKPGQPMGEMSGVAQMGFVVIRDYHDLWYTLSPSERRCEEPCATRTKKPKPTVFWTSRA